MQTTSTSLALNKPVLSWYLWGVVFLEALDIAALAAPLLNSMHRSFPEIDPRALSLVFTVNLFANMLATPFGARAADRWNRKVLLATSLGLVAIGALAAAFADSWTLVLAGRAISGVGVGMFLPLVTVLAGWRRSPEQQSRFLGGMGLAFGLAFLFGTPLSAALGARGLWRVSFLIEAGLALLLLACIWMASRESARPPFVGNSARERSLDLPGLALFGIAIGLFAAALSLFDISQGIADWIRLETGGCALGGAAIFFLWLRWEKRARQPFWNPGINTPTLRQLYLRAGLTGFWESGLGFLPLAASLLLGIPKEGLSGLVLTPVLVVMGGVSLIVGRVLPTWGWSILWRLGSLSILLGTVSLLFTSFWGPFLWPGLGFFGLGLACLIGAPLRWAIWKAAAQDETATALGMMNTSLNLGQVLGSALWGAWLGTYPGQPLGPIGAFACSAILALVAGVWNVRRQTKTWPA